MQHYDHIFNSYEILQHPIKKSSKEREFPHCTDFTRAYETWNSNDWAG